MLKLKNLSVYAGDKNILDDISFHFEQKKIYALMGPNGSGKSTLGYTIMGHPLYKVGERSRIIFQNKDITRLKPEKRAQKGIFLSFQTPISLSGVSVFQLLRYSLGNKMDIASLYERIRRFSAKLNIPASLLERPLNEDFSGGEKKTMEVLQAALINPKLLIFDEIDTGLDVDALRTIASFINKFFAGKKTLILITHYSRIFKFIKPYQVLVLKDKKIFRSGDYKLVEKIEKGGYNSI